MWLNSLKDIWKKKKNSPLHFGWTPKTNSGLGCCHFTPFVPCCCSILAKSFSFLTEASNMRVSGKVIVWSTRFQNYAICLNLQAALCRWYTFGPYLLSMHDTQRHAVVSYVVLLKKIVQHKSMSKNKMTEWNRHLTEVYSKTTSTEKQNCLIYFGPGSLFRRFWLTGQLFALTSQYKKYCVNRSHVFEW